MKYIAIVLTLAVLVLPATADKGFCEAASADFYSGSSGSSSFSGGSSEGFHSAISDKINSHINSLLVASGQTSDGSVTGNLQSLISGGSLPSTTLPSASVSENLPSLISMPDTSSSLGRSAAISSTQAGFAAIGGGSTFDSGVGGGSSGGSSNVPSVSSPCPGVVASNIPASAATYAAVHGG